MRCSLYPEPREPSPKSRQRWDTRRLAQAMEASGLAGQTAAGDEAEGVGLAQSGTEAERAGWVGFRGRGKHIARCAVGRVCPAGGALTN